MAEGKEFYKQSIPYFVAAVAYIDGITDANEKAMQRKNLYDGLEALSSVYSRLEMYDELKPVKQRISEIQSQQ